MVEENSKREEQERRREKDRRRRKKIRRIGEGRIRGEKKIRVDQREKYYFCLLGSITFVVQNLANFRMSSNHSVIETLCKNVDCSVMQFVNLKSVYKNIKVKFIAVCRFLWNDVISKIHHLTLHKFNNKCNGTP